MVPEQQQRILGYFIEEAKDHLNTIEQGLLNLQATISNPEMANELFRAAHSVKGGAAMLGIESMQRTSHRMEDYFKLLKEAPIQVDRPLESMFLRVFDALQELLEQLQGPFGLTEDKEQSIMGAVEPVFQQLQEHLDQLVAAAGPSEVTSQATTVAPVASTVPSPRLVEESALKLVFSSDVSAALREMLARFKQADTDDSRSALEGCCRLFERFGEQFNLPIWMNLVKHARWAVCDRNNDYRTLAPVLIKEIKKAQDLVLAGRESEIFISETLQTLAAQGDAVEAIDDLGGLFANQELESPPADDIDELPSLEPNLGNESSEPAAESEDGISLDDLLNDAAASPSGPEVGAAELTSLADLFETGGDSLNSDWQEEEVPLNDSTSPTESLDIDIAPDFEDLLNDDTSELGATPNDFESGSELADLFGDTDTTNTDTTDTTDTLDTLDGELGNLNGQTDAADDFTTAATETLDASIDGLFNDVAADDSTDVDDLFGDLDVAEPSLDSGLEDLTAQTDVPDSQDAILSENLSSSTDDLFDDMGATNDTSSVDDLFGQSDIDPPADNTTDSGINGVDNLFGDIDLPDIAADDEEDAASVDDLFSDGSLDLPDIAADGEDNAASVDDLFSDGNIDLPDIAATTDNDIASSVDDLFSDGGLDLPDVASDSEEDAASVDDLFSDSGIDTSDAADGESNLLGQLSDELVMSDGLSSSEATNDEPLVDIAVENTAIEPDVDGFLGSTPDDAPLPTTVDSFFADTADTTDGISASDLDIDTPASEVDDFFTLTEAASTTEPTGELESLSDDLWGADSISNASAADEHSVSDDLAGDIWAEPKQQPDELEPTSEIFAELDESSLINNDIAAVHQPLSTESDEADLEDMWASVEDLGLGDIGPDADIEGEGQTVTNTPSEELELDDLFGSSEAASTDAPDLDQIELDVSPDNASSADQASGELSDNNIDASSEPENNDLDNLFSDADIADIGISDADIIETDISLENNEPPPVAELADLENLDIAAADINPPPSNVDLELGLEATDNSTDILSEPPSNAIDFDLLDLEDDGIVTGFITDNEGTDESSSSSPESTIDLDNFLDTPESASDATAPAALDLESLDSLLSEPPEPPESMLEEATSESSSNEFGELEALINSPGTDSSEPSSPATEAVSTSDIDDEFGDLEALLQDTNQTLTPKSASSSTSYRPTPSRLSARRMMTDQTMRVSVSHLDNLSNLVGELVVNRNTLEQDQERLRQFLDNLLFQVQQLNDVGQRMRDLYERSLLESSLISSRQSYQVASSGITAETTEIEDHATGESFDALEMDRFTGFHTLSQEMIELIVRVRESAADIAYTVESSDQVTRQFRQVTNQLQEGLNKARMVPFAQTASRLPRAVRDISLKCGKEARLVVEGRDILIDKMILEQLYDPMTHLVNNAITHGVETPEERLEAGKAAEGLITVQAFYQGNQTVISVGDDGAGIDPDIVKQKALQKGLISQTDAQTMSVLDVYDLLFHPGFSTRDQADDFAGRGFGMDVVRTSLADIRGNITIDSELGRGTSFTIRLPLTLSISKALSCISNQARIAFPMDGVEDMFDVSRERIQQDDQGQDCILWRDTLLPFQNLSDLLSFNRTLGRGRVYGGNQDENMISIVVLRSANSFIALEVDQVMGEQEIVIKQLEGPVPKPTGIAGATVLGDGRVMPIADVLELIDLAMGRVRREPNAAVWAQDEAPPEEAVQVQIKSEPTVLIVDDSITVRELLSMSFNKVGYRVEQARDGQEAWEKLRSGLPCDLVFCDIEMPRMDGLELLSRLQKDDGLKQIPIAMLTSRGADRHRQMAVDLGASGYFTKPYLEEALLDAANKMLHGDRLV